MKEERGTDQRDHKELLQKLVLQRIHRPLYQIGTVVGRDDLDAIGEALLQFGKPLLDRIDRPRCVLAPAHDDHAADDFAFPIEVGHAAALELSDSEGRFADLEDLSYQRTKAVKAYLVEELNMNPQRFRLIVVAEREPLDKRDYDLDRQQLNRRVEVFEAELLIQDIQQS